MFPAFFPSSCEYLFCHYILFSITTLQRRSSLFAQTLQAFNFVGAGAGDFITSFIFAEVLFARLGTYKP